MMLRKTRHESTKHLLHVTKANLNQHRQSEGEKESV